MFCQYAKEVFHNFVSNKSVTKTGIRSNPLESLGPLSLRAAKILISAIHAWHLESSLDQFLVQKLNLKVPRWPILFGLIRTGIGIIDLPVEPNINQNGTELGSDSTVRLNFFVKKSKF